MHMKKRMIFIMVAVVVAVAGLGYVWNRVNDYSLVLDANWGFSLPDESHYSLVYSKDSGASFHGDGIRYHVFSYKNAEPIAEAFSWSQNETKTIFNASYQEAVSDWLSRIDVPAEELPEYAQCLYWYDARRDNSEIVVLWDADKRKIYIAESFL